MAKARQLRDNPPIKVNSPFQQRTIRCYIGLLQKLKLGISIQPAINGWRRGQTNDNDDVLYKRVMLYVCSDKDDLTIEIPVTEQESKQGI